MKAPSKISTHLLIRAQSHTDDPVNFAIISLSPEWKERTATRFHSITEFDTDKDHNWVGYWESPIVYFHLPEMHVLEEGLLSAGEDHGIVVLDPGDLESFAAPLNKLEGHQFLITKQGIGHYVAYANGTGEKYWTAEFDVRRFL